MRAAKIGLRPVLVGVFVILIGAFPASRLSAQEKPGPQSTGDQTPGQQAAPAEPEIVLPPVLLKVQDVTQEKIDTPLPEAQSPTLPDVNVTLPKAQNIQLGSAAYEVPAPAEGPGGAPITVSKKSTSNFFSDGLIGVGSMNHIIGDITLYKLGAGPRFTIDFSHERLDGYLYPTGQNRFNFQQAGAGFANRDDAIKGKLTYSSKDLFQFNTNDSYRETENGLQGLGTYSSVTHRFISGNAQFAFTRLSPFSFGAAIDATSGDMSVANPTPANAINASELSLNPSLQIGLDLSGVTGRLTGYFGLAKNYGANDYQSRNAGGTLKLSADLPLSLNLSGSIGVRYDESIDSWSVPFSLALDGLYKDNLTYRAYGGYRVDAGSYFTLWNEYPFLNHGVSLLASREWYGGVSVEWRFQKSLALQSSVDFSQSSEAILPLALSTAGTGLFDFKQGASTVLGPSVGISWDPQGPFSLKGGWEGHFLDANTFAPVSAFTLDAELNDAEGRYGGTLTGTMNIDNLTSGGGPLGVEMPNLGISGYLRVSDGVTFHLDMNDLLSPLIISGRKLWDTYTDPGFRVTVTTQISL